MYKMLLISNNYLLMRFLDVIIKYFIHLFNAVNKWCVPVITACFITWYLVDLKDAERTEHFLFEVL